VNRDADRVREYAHGLYKAATESWLAQLGRVSDGLKANPALRLALDDPATEFTDKVARLAILLPADTDREVRSFLSLLISRNEIKLLDRIIDEFERQVKGGVAPLVAEITAAVALTAEERATLEQRIRAGYGPDVQFKYTVNPEILGGLIIRVGDKILDGSVATRLSRLREQIVAAL
jgi:F-type H+-transporting ATPase subunit delta